MLNALFVAVFTEMAGDVQTKYFANKQQFTECYPKNVIIQHRPNTVFPYYNYCCYLQIEILQFTSESFVLNPNKNKKIL